MQETRESSERRPTLRELEVLRTLIAYGKATAAARKLGISQPAVSRAIHQLEKRTGLTLFRREGGRLVPTADALALHKESEAIFITFDRLERVRWRPEEARPTLRFASPPTLTQWFFNQLLADFSRSEPDTRIYVEIGSGQSVLSMVANGDMDLGVVDALQAHIGVQYNVFRSSYAHAIVPRDSPLANEPEITPRHLEDVPFVALLRRFPTRTQLDRLFLAANISPRVVIEVSTAGAAYEFVRAGVGIAITNPFPMSLRHDDDVRLIPFRPAIAYETSFVLPSLTPPSPVARRFIDFVLERQPEDGYSQAIRAK